MERAITVDESTATTRTPNHLGQTCAARPHIHLEHHNATNAAPKHPAVATYKRIASHSLSMSWSMSTQLSSINGHDPTAAIASKPQSNTRPADRSLQTKVASRTRSMTGRTFVLGGMLAMIGPVRRASVLRNPHRVLVDVPERLESTETMKPEPPGSG